LRDEILGQVRAALPLDIVALGMHGAMVAEGYDDCEGDLLARVREIVGPRAAVGATLDPHGHISQQMLDAADLLISWKEYPHTDINERAEELLDLLAQQAEGRIHLTHACVDCEMISLILTTQEPGASLVRRMREMERRPGVLSVSLNHGFPWGDVPDMGTKVMVYADSDRDLAARIARELADEVVDCREAMQIDRPDVDRALDLALAHDEPPVVIADSADNAGGGAASDSTWFLRRMLERRITGAAVGAIWDPVVVGIAFDAGQGARLALRLGGKVGPQSGVPLDVEARVVSLQRDHRMQGLTEDMTVECGDAVLLDVDGIDVVVTSKRVQPMGTDLFSGLGCDLPTKRIVVVKSSQHFFAHFSRIAGKVIYAEAPGAVTLALDTLDYRKIRLPRWPLACKARQATLAPPLPAQDEPRDWLETQIRDLATGYGVVVGVSAQQVGGSRRVEYQAQRRFPMASTYKVAIAAAVLSGIDAGRGSLMDRIEVPRQRHVIEGVISAMFPHDGMALSVANLLEVMLTDSDNTATDLLFEYVGGPVAVMRWLGSVGVEEMRVDRTCDHILRDVFEIGEEGTNVEAALRLLARPDFDRAQADEYLPAVETEERDTTTPRAMVDLLLKLNSGGVLSPASFDFLQSAMRRCQAQRRPWVRRLAGRLPADTTVAHKGGTLPGVVNDVGWFDLSDGRRFVAAVYTRHGITPRPRREQFVEEVGRLLHGAFR
jgi:microcystin degradation protein MlrC/beta-lactamase class A